MPRTNVQITQFSPSEHGGQMSQFRVGELTVQIDGYGPATTKPAYLLARALAEIILADIEGLKRPPANDLTQAIALAKNPGGVR